MNPKQAEDAEKQEPMPSSEEESAKTQEVAQETEEAPEVQAGDSEELELPEKGVSERTREQFDKLKGQLQEYRQRLFNEQRYRDIESKEGESEPLYDKTTGLVNIKALEDLERKATEADKRARQAEQRIQQTVSETQVRELYSVYPELKNPKTKQEKEFFDQSERIWMHSLAYPEKYGGDSLSQKQAADLAKKSMESKPETPKEEAQRVEPKEQASLGASGKPTQGVQSKISSEEELTRLKVGTRLGDKDSMIARMRAIREAEAEASE
jgi:hypothetical protein